MKWLTFLVTILCIAPAYAQMTPTPDDRARQWLTLVDDGNYAEAHKQAGAGLHTASVTAWTQKITALRAPMGAMSARNIKDVKLTRTRPGMRDDQIATVRYDSAFAHKAAAVETLVLASENGAWSVQSYTIE